jgi:hypothetical protein
MKFQVEDERDALAIAEDIALLEGIEFVFCQRLRYSEVPRKH